MLFKNVTVYTIYIKKKMIESGKSVELTEAELSIPTVKQMIDDKLLVAEGSAPVAKTTPQPAPTPVVEQPAQPKPVEQPKPSYNKNRFERPARNEVKPEPKVEEAVVETKEESAE